MGYSMRMSLEAVNGGATREKQSHSGEQDSHTWLWLLRSEQGEDDVDDASLRLFEPAEYAEFEMTCHKKKIPSNVQRPFFVQFRCSLIII